MKVHPLFGLWGVVFFLCACSRDYKVNIQLEPKEIVGDWSPSIAPPAVMQVLPTNSLSKVHLTLYSDGTAHFNSLPFQEFPTSTSMRSSQWSIVSGEGRWDLTDEGDNGRHIWKLCVITPVRGLQLTVGKNKAGHLILVYIPDPDNEDQSVIFTLKPSTRN